MGDATEPRAMDAVLALLALVLAAGYLGRDDYTDAKIIEERKQQIAHCQKVQEQHARNLTTLLDRGGVLFINGEPVTTCRKV